MGKSPNHVEQKMPDILEYVVHAFIYLFYTRLGETNKKCCKIYEEFFGIGNFSNNPTNWKVALRLLCSFKLK